MRLKFYKKGLPVKTIKKLIILLFIFIVFTAFFEFITNVSEDVVISDMESPTLPLLTVSHLEGSANTLLHGYLTEMDTSYMRDAIIPLDSERKIDLEIQCYDFDVDSVSYEIRSLDTQRKIASNNVPFTESNGLINLSITAENLIDVGEEYLLVFTLSNEDNNVFYYTRIMQTEGCHEKELVDYAIYFHNTALSEDATELSTYIEPDRYAANDTLNSVNINSNLNQISYGDFDGYQIGETYVTITDISSNYVTLTLSYELKRGEKKNSEYYTCSEDFRVRYTQDRIYLLAYNRSMEQLLSKNSIQITDNLVNIGIRDENVQFLSNETGTIVAFVQGGTLFEYNQTKRQLNQIYSFVGDDYTDLRAIYDQHKILILNIDESGTMDFVVYGYMNSGGHEGQCGINLFHYDSITNTSTEQVFISSTKSFQILNASFSNLLYETADNEFYIFVNNSLLHIQLNDLTTSEILSNLDESQYAVSGSGRYIAWMDSPYVSDTIHILDLERGSTYDIKADKGQLLKPLAYMDNDLIYGTVFEHDVMEDAAGSTIYPMFKLTISDISNNSEQQLMNYSKANIYVSDISIESYTIYLNRITISADGMISDASLDTIKNSAGEQNKAVPITTEFDAVKQKVVILNMSPLDDSSSASRIKFDSPGLVLANGTRDVTVSTSMASTEYFVYVGNRVTLATDNLIEAISVADENMGVVLDNEQRYIWKRGKKSYQNSLSGIAVGSSDNEASGMAMALSAMLVHEGENVQVHTLLESGESVISIMGHTLKDYTILDLTGASLSQVLYYVSVSSPVLAMTGDDTAVIIVGYDANSIIYYDPIKGSNSRMSLSDATDYFAGFGNVFVSYLE